MTNFIIVEGCNFLDFPVGGQLTFVRQLMHAYGNKVALVGISTDETPVGKWVKKSIDGVEYDFFAYDRRLITARKPLVPVRLSGYIKLSRYSAEILTIGGSNVFLQSHELLPIVLSWRSASVCFCFPGIENPLTISRYRWAASFAGVFDRWFLPKVLRADVVLAAADENAIKDLKSRCKGILMNKTISVFPTRVDTALFRPGDRVASRNKLGISNQDIIIITTGRIHWAKGWSLLIQSFKYFLEANSTAKLYFIGDGEERDELFRNATTLGIADKVAITGHLTQTQVAEYLGCADIFTLASVKEGWSTALVEALASGLPIVSTDVSSASSIIRDGVNGFIVKDRSPRTYADAMAKALELDSRMIRELSVKEALKYSVGTLQKRLSELWPKPFLMN